jgi:hypothetical protein
MRKYTPESLVKQCREASINEQEFFTYLINYSVTIFLKLELL